MLFLKSTKKSKQKDRYQNLSSEDISFGCDQIQNSSKATKFMALSCCMMFKNLSISTSVAGNISSNSSEVVEAFKKCMNPK